MSDKDIEQDREPTAEEHVPVEETMEDEDRPVEDAPAEVVTAEEVPAEDVSAEDVQPVERVVKQRGNGVAWLALLVALLATAAIAYTMYNDWLASNDTGADEAYADLDGRLSATRDGIGALDNES